MKLSPANAQRKSLPSEGLHDDHHCAVIRGPPNSKAYSFRAQTIQTALTAATAATAGTRSKFRIVRRIFSVMATE